MAAGAVLPLGRVQNAVPGITGICMLSKRQAIQAKQVFRKLKIYTMGCRLPQGAASSW